MNYDMDAAIDPAGNAVAVWRKSDGGGARCWSNYHTVS